MTTLTAGQQTEVDARAYRRADFVRLEFPAADLAFTTLDHDITVSAVDYVAGVLNGITGIRAATDRRAGQISLSLNAADPDLRTAIEGDIHFARMTYSIAVLTKDNEIVSGLIPIAVALVSSPVLKIDETSAELDLVCESEVARFLRPRRIIGQDADQRWRFSGDKGLELVPRVPRSEAEWGGSPQRPGGGGRSGGGVAVHFTQNLH